MIGGIMSAIIALRQSLVFEMKAEEDVTDRIINYFLLYRDIYLLSSKFVFTL